MSPQPIALSFAHFCAVVLCTTALSTTAQAQNSGRAAEETDLASILGGQTPEVLIVLEGDQRCVISNGIPNHDAGPWRAGAVVEAHEHRFCMDANPTLTGVTAENVRISGVTVTGIPLRPGTAEFFDASSERGYSRDRASGWNVEGVGGLVMDAQNAHVDGDGLYHYHGVPSAVVEDLSDALFGYAADGFEILFEDPNQTSSWRLKSGERASGPSGVHDGTYVQDFEYVEGSGTLDECNGTFLDGTYTYFATEEYPFFPRCFKGSVSEDFIGGRGSRGSRRSDG
jgi:hypothetical protein